MKPRRIQTYYSLACLWVDRGDPARALSLLNRALKIQPSNRRHLIARAGGNNDLSLEDFLQKMKPEDRAAAEKAAQPWIEAMKEQRLLEAQGSQAIINPP